MIVPLVIAFMACVFGTAIIFRIIAAVENVERMRTLAQDPRTDEEAQRRAAEQVRKPRPNP